MPRSDVWPGDATMDTMAHTDSAGSLDSVLSLSLGSSDDSLEYLSAEERACLMFLEETIEALEAEEDSGVSNDEPERLAGVTGSLAARIAHLSSVMALGKQDNLPKYLKRHPNKEADKEKSFVNSRVATPLILANENSIIQLKDGLKVSSAKAKVWTKPSDTAADHKPENGRQSKQSSEAAVTRGPLSYEGLKELRKGTSVKKATAGSSSESTTAQSAAPTAALQPPSGSLHVPAACSPVQPTGTEEKSPPKLTPPPVVLPKPKPWQSGAGHKAGAQVAVCVNAGESYLSTSSSEKIVMDPQRVRNEALCKLGLLKSGKAPLHSIRTRQISEPTLTHPGPGLISKAQPTSSRGTKADLKNLQAPRPSNVKSATLERSGFGPVGSRTDHTSSDHGSSQATPEGPAAKLRNNRARPASLGNQKDFEGIRDGFLPAAPGAPGLEEAAKAAPISFRRSHGASVVIKPRCSSGDDRQEALRKLGLLKNKES